MEYVNLDKTEGYKALQEGKKSSVKELLTPERIKASSIKLGGGLNYNWAAMPISEETEEKLQKLLKTGKNWRRNSGKRRERN